MKRVLAVTVTAAGAVLLACGAAQQSTGVQPAVADTSAPANQSAQLIQINLDVGKNPEGIAVNPVTHKAYVISEQNIEGDDQYAVFVLDGTSLKTKAASKKLVLKMPATATRTAVIPIPNENEYLAVDSKRNLIYVGTRFHLAGNEQPDDEGGDTGADVEPPGGTVEPVLPPITVLDPETVVLGTLTVIDGNTDQVIAIWYFDVGIEPEGVAVDPDTGVVYLGAKAPEGEASDDDYCAFGTPIPDIGEPADVECWTAGSIYAFSVDPANPDPNARIKWLKTIPAGDDPESVAFANGMIYAANEDDGTVTIATAVIPDGNGGSTGGTLVTDFPKPPYVLDPTTGMWSFEPYSLRGFTDPNPLACLENQLESDKMAAGGGAVFMTDDRSRVAKISGSSVVGWVEIPGASVCEYIPNTDGGGLNTANNIAYLNNGLLVVASEQNTVALVNPQTLKYLRTITVPGAVHLDAIAADTSMTRVWITDEDLHAVFVLQGACAVSGACAP